MSRARRRHQQRSSHESAGIMPADSRATIRLTDGGHGTLLACNVDVDSLVYEVVLNVHFVTRGDNYISVRGFDRLVGRCRLGGSNRVETQRETTFATTVGHAIGELSVTTQLEHTEQDVRRRLTRDGFANLDVRFQVRVDIATQGQSRLANVLAGATSQQGESGESGGVGYVFHAKLLCTYIPWMTPLRGQYIALGKAAAS